MRMHRLFRLSAEKEEPISVVSKNLWHEVILQNARSQRSIFSAKVRDERPPHASGVIPARKANQQETCQ